MNLLYCSLITLLVSAVASLAAGRGKAANVVGSCGAILGCLIGLAFALDRLIGGGTASVNLAWSVPLGQLSLTVDGLSALFLLPVFVLGAAAAAYGQGLLAFYAGHKHLGAHWFFFNLMVAALAVVLCASDAVLFLASWEIMSLSPFFLISFHDEEETVRQAAWTYLVAAHAGFAFLMVVFVLLVQASGRTDFASFLGVLGPGTAGAVFLLGLAGFGVKAGLFPLHIWLPEAHPAAPSHVSAFLSGALIKAGIYGFARLTTFLGQPAPWQAYLLVGIGLATALMGIVSATGKRHLKRVLAYSSVENMGLVVLGLGLSALAQAAGRPDLAAIGAAGALLHVLAHCLMKGTLFLAAGSVLHGAGTAFMDQLGGLMKPMPHTGRAFALGAAAICGLPPLAGFFSELVLYVTAGRLGVDLGGVAAFASWAAVAGMALTGGLAAIVFSKAFGMAFLGEPRSDAPGHAHDPSALETGPMLALAVACLAAGLSAPLLLGLAAPAVAVLAPEGFTAGLDWLRPILGTASAAGGVLLALGLGLALLRRRLLFGRPVGAAGTWDCGYAAPTVRMEYTPSSFSQPLTDIIGPLSGQTANVLRPQGYFPVKAAYLEDRRDMVRERAFVPLFSALDWLADHLKWLQHGNLNLYILYILVTLLALLAWNQLIP